MENAETPDIFQLMEATLKVSGPPNCRLLSIAQISTSLLSTNVHMLAQSPDSPESMALQALVG